MTTRRDFLARTSLALAGGLLLGDEAMEALARLTHRRKSFPSARVGEAQKGYAMITDLIINGQHLTLVPHIMVGPNQHIVIANGTLRVNGHPLVMAADAVNPSYSYTRTDFNANGIASSVNLRVFSQTRYL